VPVALGEVRLQQLDVLCVVVGDEDARRGGGAWGRGLHARLVIASADEPAPASAGSEGVRCRSIIAGAWLCSVFGVRRSAPLCVRGFSAAGLKEEGGGSRRTPNEGPSPVGGQSPGRRIIPDEFSACRRAGASPCRNDT